MCAECAADRHRGVSAGPQPESRGTEHGVPPLEHFLASWVLFCLILRNGLSCCAHPGSSWLTVLQSCLHRPPLDWDLTSTFLVPAPSQGVPGPLQLRGQGKQRHFVLSWRRSRVGRVLISSSGTCGLWCPGLTASLWAAVQPRLLLAPLLTGWSVF